MHKYLSNTLRSVVWFKQVSTAGTLDIQPPFQRNPVWTDRQKSSLIDTILLEYPIPELYMQDVTNEEGIQRHILVDGQQRIRSVLGFLSEEFVLEEDSPHWAGMSFEDLTGTDKKKVYEYSFVVRLLPEMAPEQLSAIFQRLNRNTTTLNAQELRHATYWGPFIKFTEDMSDLTVWDDFGLFSANDRRRMLDAEYVAELAVAYLNGLQNKKTLLEAYFESYDRSFEEEAYVRSVFIKVLGEIQQTLPELRKSRWRKKSDFYTLFLVFAKNESRLPLAAEQRVQVRDLLQRFGSIVDAYLRSDIPSLPNTNFEEYVRGVERAASDYGSRDRRSTALEMELAEVFPL